MKWEIIHDFTDVDNTTKITVISEHTILNEALALVDELNENASSVEVYYIRESSQ